MKKSVLAAAAIAAPGVAIRGGTASLARRSVTGFVNRTIDGAFYSSPYDGKYLGRAALVAGLKYNF